MLVRKEADVLELTEIVEGDFDVRFFHSLREVEIIVTFSSIIDLVIKIIFVLILLFFFFFVLLFFFFFGRLFFLIRIGEVVDLAFISLRVEIVDPFDSNRLSSLDSVFTLSVDVLEKVESGRQKEELAPIIKLIS